MNSLWWGYEIYTYVWNFELGGWEEICNAGDTLAFTNLDDLWPEFWETWDHELDDMSWRRQCASVQMRAGRGSVIPRDSKEVFPPNQ